MRGGLFPRRRCRISRRRPAGMLLVFAIMVRRDPPSAIISPVLRGARAHVDFLDLAHSRQQAVRSWCASSDPTAISGGRPPRTVNRHPRARALGRGRPSAGPPLRAGGTPRQGRPPIPEDLAREALRSCRLRGNDTHRRNGPERLRPFQTVPRHRPGGRSTPWNQSFHRGSPCTRPESLEGWADRLPDDP
jgi:hypothetical protein